MDEMAVLLYVQIDACGTFEEKERKISTLSSIIRFLR